MQHLRKCLSISLRKRSFSQKQFPDIDPAEAFAKLQLSVPTLCEVFNIFIAKKFALIRHKIKQLLYKIPLPTI